MTGNLGCPSPPFLASEDENQPAEFTPSSLSGNQLGKGKASLFFSFYEPRDRLVTAAWQFRTPFLAPPLPIFLRHVWERISLFLFFFFFRPEGWSDSNARGKERITLFLLPPPIFRDDERGCEGSLHFFFSFFPPKKVDEASHRTSLPFPSEDLFFLLFLFPPFSSSRCGTQ